MDPIFLHMTLYSLTPKDFQDFQDAKRCTMTKSFVRYKCGKNHGDLSKANFYNAWLKLEWHFLFWLAFFCHTGDHNKKNVCEKVFLASHALSHVIFFVNVKFGFAFVRLSFANLLVSLFRNPPCNLWASANIFFRSETVDSSSCVSWRDVFFCGQDVFVAGESQAL